MEKIMKERYARRRKEQVGIANQRKRLSVVERYLPEGYSIRETGWPAPFEAFLQWEIRHIGLIELAQEVFLENPLPVGHEERVRRWHQAMALVAAASHAMEDFNELLEWAIDTWQSDAEAVEFALRFQTIHETSHVNPSPDIEPIPDTPVDSSPFSDPS